MGLRKFLIPLDIQDEHPMLAARARAMGLENLTYMGSQDLLHELEVYRPQLVLLPAIPVAEQVALAQTISETLPQAHVLGIADEAAPSGASVSEWISRSAIEARVLEVAAELFSLELPTEISEHERRRLSRIKVQGRVYFSWRGRDIDSAIENLSLKGVLVKSNIPIPEGGTLEGALEAQDGKTCEMRFQVIRVTDSPSVSGGRNYHCALHFVNMTLEKAAFIENWLLTGPEELSQSDESPVESQSEVGQPTSGSGPLVQPRAFVIQEADSGNALEISVVSINPPAFVFASDRSFDVGQQLRLRLLFSRELELQGEVQKSSKLKKRFPHGQQGTALVIRDLATPQGEDLQVFAQENAAFERLQAPLPPAELRQLLAQGFEAIEDQVRRGELVYPWTSIGAVSDFERAESLRSSDFSRVVQAMLLLRGKCSAFARFVPVMGEQAQALSGFINDLQTLYQSLAQVEQEADECVRQAVAQDWGDVRVGLVAQQNLLFDQKKALWIAVAEHLSGRAEFSEYALIKDIVSQVQTFGVVLSGPETIKYGRKAVEETKPVPETKEPPSEVAKRKKKLIRWAVITSVVLAISVWSSLPSYLSPKEVGITFDVHDIQETEEGIRIRCDPGAWKRLSQEDQDANFVKMEDYLFKNNKRQAKVVDVEDKTLAATVVTVRRMGGERPDFRRRLYYKD